MIDISEHLNNNARNFNHEESVMKSIRCFIAVTLSLTGLLLAGCGNTNDSNLNNAQTATAQTNAKIIQDSGNSTFSMLGSAGTLTMLEYYLDRSTGFLQFIGAAKSSEKIVARIGKLPLTDQLQPGYVAGKTVKKALIMEHYSSSFTLPPPPTLPAQPAIPAPAKQAAPKTAYMPYLPVTAYSVDTFGRLTKQAMMAQYSTQYKYVGDSSKVESVLYSDLGRVSFTYDELGRISSYNLGTATVNVTYTLTGRIETCNNLSITFDVHNNPVAMTDGTVSARILRTYDILGREIKAEYFIKTGSADEIKSVETTFSYGLVGIINCTITVIKSVPASAPAFDTISITTSYNGTEVARRELAYKDSASGTILRSEAYEYSGQTYEAGNLITYIENYISGPYSYFNWFRQVWVTLVSGKDNQ